MCSGFIFIYTRIIKMFPWKNIFPLRHLKSPFRKPHFAISRKTPHQKAGVWFQTLTLQFRVGFLLGKKMHDPIPNHNPQYSTVCDSGDRGGLLKYTSKATGHSGQCLSLGQLMPRGCFFQPHTSLPPSYETHAEFEAWEPCMLFFI